jgi:hypothetical protein
MKWANGGRETKLSRDGLFLFVVGILSWRFSLNCKNLMNYHEKAAVNFNNGFFLKERRG